MKSCTNNDIEETWFGFFKYPMCLCENQDQVKNPLDWPWEIYSILFLEILILLFEKSG